MSAVIHASGFITPGEHAAIKLHQYEGTLAEVTTDFIAAEQSRGFETRVRTTRSLSGWLKAVSVIIDTSHAVDAPVGTHRMWHWFTDEWSDPWPLTLAPVPADGEGT